MRFLTLSVLLTWLFCSPLKSQNIQIVSQDKVLEMLKKRPDSGYIVYNFWATWCPPCLDELEYFIKADTTLRGENYTFVFISLDPERSVKSTSRFVRKMGLPGEQYLMNQDSIAQFMQSADEHWQGAIPFTILVSKDGQKSHEGAFMNFKDLWNFIRFD